MAPSTELHHPAKSLVFVIGAGASYEAKLPLGAQLKKQIGELPNITVDESAARVSLTKPFVSYQPMRSFTS